MSQLSFLLRAVLFSLVATIILAGVSWRLTRRFGPIDVPGSAAHKIHAIPRPVAGGLTLFGALLVSTWLFQLGQNPMIVAALAAGGLIFAFGLWDDYVSLPATVKLIGQVLAAVLLIRLGVFVQIFSSPQFFSTGTIELDQLLNWLFTILWVVGITNAFNFVDSMDGLAVGLGGIAAAFLMIMTLDAGQTSLALLNAMLLGICAALYFFNSPPAFFFMGDSGAQTLGFLLAVVSIAYRPIGTHQASSWFVPILVLGLPIFDIFLVVISRLRHRSPVYQAGRDHTYHRLVSLGFDSNHAVLVMHFGSLLVGCLAVIALNLSPWFANLLFVSTLLLGLAGIWFFDFSGFIRFPAILQRKLPQASPSVQDLLARDALSENLLAKDPPAGSHQTENHP